MLGSENVKQFWNTKNALHYKHYTKAMGTVIARCLLFTFKKPNFHGLTPAWIQGHFLRYC